jgi:hypothetical protein
MLGQCLLDHVVARPEVVDDAAAALIRAPSQYAFAQLEMIGGGPYAQSVGTVAAKLIAADERRISSAARALGFVVRGASRAGARLQTDHWDLTDWGPAILAHFLAFDEGLDPEPAMSGHIDWRLAWSLLDHPAGHLRLIAARGSAVAALAGDAGPDPEALMASLYFGWRTDPVADVAASCAAALAVALCRTSGPFPADLPELDLGFVRAECSIAASSVPRRYRRAAALATGWRMKLWTHEEVHELASIWPTDPWLGLLPPLRAD